MAAIKWSNPKKLSTPKIKSVKVSPVKLSTSQTKSTRIKPFSGSIGVPIKNRFGKLVK